MNNKNSGWVKLWREQFNHEISERKPWCDGYAWSYLYSRANFRPTIVNFRNQYIHVERGQFVTSKSKLQVLFGWSKKRVNSFLTSLEVGGMSTTRTTNRFIIITICNYGKFQSTEDEKGSAEGPTESQQRATDKNEKKEKNNNMSESDHSDFNIFYQAYPKRESKKKALEAWVKIKPDQTLVTIILSAIEKQKIHKAGLKSRNEFCPEWPLPATWLNGRRWEDEIPDIKQLSSQKSGDQNSICPRCRTQIPLQDRTADGCIHCENKTAEATA